MHFHDSERNAQRREWKTYGKIIIRLKNAHIYGKIKRMSSIRRFVRLVFLLNGISRETRKKEQIAKVVHFKICMSKSYSCAFYGWHKNRQKRTWSSKSRVKSLYSEQNTKHKSKQNIELKNFMLRMDADSSLFCFRAFSAIQIYCVDIKMSREHLMEQNVSFFRLRNSLYSLFVKM